MIFKEIFNMRNLRDGWFFEWKWLVCLGVLGMITMPLSFLYLALSNGSPKDLNYYYIIILVSTVGIIFKWLVYGYYIRTKTNGVSNNNKFWSLGFSFFWRWALITMPAGIMLYLAWFTVGSKNIFPSVTIALLSMAVLRVCIVLFSTVISGYIYNSIIFPKLDMIPFAETNKILAEIVCSNCGGKNKGDAKDCVKCGMILG